MDKDTLMLLKDASWVTTTGLCLAYARYSAYPKFSAWFWCIFFWMEILFFAVRVTVIALRK